MEKVKKIAGVVLEVLLVVIPVLVTLKDLCEKLAEPKHESDEELPETIEL